MLTRDLLNSERIIETVDMLSLRISDRFPESGLSRVATSLHRISQETDEQLFWIEKKNIWFRLLVGGFIVMVAIVLVYTIVSFEVTSDTLTLADIVTIFESGINDVIILGAAFIFLISIETRTKRKRIILFVNRLRSIAHIIDAHQLTKDPAILTSSELRTEHSPERVMTPFELERYLDYCSELLSLTSKVAFLHVQNFDDSVAIHAVNDLENLTNSLSRKIWQKIMILKNTEG